MTKLLNNESCLMIQPSIAVKYGIESAIILHQIHYYLNNPKNTNTHEGHKWVFNSYKQWSKLLKCINEHSIKRYINNLEKKGILISKVFNKNTKVKFYRINYEVLNDDFNCNVSEINVTKADQNTPLYRAECSNIESKMIHSYNEIQKRNKNLKYNSLTQVINPGSNNSINCDFTLEREIVKIWNLVVNEGRDEIQFHQSRIYELKKVLEFFSNDLSFWEDYCKKIASSKFLMGEGRDWKAGFHWSIQIKNIRKVLDGEYKLGDRVATPKTPESQSIIAENKKDATWKKVLDKLESRLGKPTVLSWFEKLEYKKTGEGLFELSNDSRFICNYVETQYKHKICQAFIEAGEYFQNLDIKLDSNLKL